MCVGVCVCVCVCVSKHHVRKTGTQVKGEYTELPITVCRSAGRLFASDTCWTNTFAFFLCLRVFVLVSSASLKSFRNYNIKTKKSKEIRLQLFHKIWKKSNDIENHVDRAVRLSRLWEDYGRVTVNVDLDDYDSWMSRLRKKGWNKQKKYQTEISLPELQQHVVIFQPTERISYFRSKTGSV